MKMYAPWLLLLCLFITSVMQAVEMKEHVVFGEVDAAVINFDAPAFGAALSNLGPLCIFAKMMVRRDLINKKNNSVAACKQLMSFERLPYPLAELGVEAVVAFIGGFFFLGAGGAIMMAAHQERGPFSSQWVSYPTGFISLLCSICAFYRFHTIHAQEDARRAAKIERLQQITQRISNDAEAMLSMIENHPLKTCCSELSGIHTETQSV